MKKTNKQLLPWDSVEFNLDFKHFGPEYIPRFIWIQFKKYQVHILFRCNTQLILENDRIVYEVCKKWVTQNSQNTKMSTYTLCSS